MIKNKTNFWASECITEKSHSNSHEKVPVKKTGFVIPFERNMSVKARKMYFLHCRDYEPQISATNDFSTRQY